MSDFKKFSDSYIKMMSQQYKSALETVKRAQEFAVSEWVHDDESKRYAQNQIKEAKAYVEKVWAEMDAVIVFVENFMEEGSDSE